MAVGSSLGVSVANVPQSASLPDLRSALIAKRTALLAHIWPSGRPTDWTLSSGPTWEAANHDWPEADGWWHLVFDMGHGFTSTMRLIAPKAALYPHKNEAIIIHPGHDGASWNGPYNGWTKYFLARGYHVVTCSMLFHGDNSNVVNATVPGVGAVVMTQHNDLAQFDGSGVSGISKFVDHLNQCLNWMAVAHPELTRVHLTGLSGGGWISSFFPAIDTRIHHAVAVAGSMYKTLWGTTPASSVDNTGEYEQHTGPWLNVVSYHDIYALAAFNRPPGGLHRLTYNKFDYYYSSYGRYEAIEEATRRVQRMLGGGALGQHCWVEDASHGSIPLQISEHIISDQTLAQIYADLLRP